MAAHMARSVYRHSAARLWVERHPWTLRTAVAVVAAGVGAGVTLWFTAHHSQGARSSRGGVTGVGAAGGTGPFTVTSTTPSAGAHVDSGTTVSVEATRPVDLTGPLPTFSPSLPGSWARHGDTISFDASSPLIPGTSETMTIPGGAGGLRSTSGQTLAQPTSISFTVASSTLRLQQLLAQLGYLPVSFTPSAAAPAPRELAAPQPGSFTWRFSDSLSGLEDRWGAGDFGVLTQGAIMTFQDQHHLTVDGVAGPRLWTALLQAASAGQHDPEPYDYVYVDKDVPEHLTMWVDGVAKFPNVAVNTGLHGADTPDGTYPVFEHVTASEMKGTNPDGTTYDDPNVPWASYFFQGDALHGFVRPTYGSPQSNGCVEMSIADAGTLWPYTPIGTLVTVTGPPS